MLVAYRLKQITLAAESTGAETSMRVARQNREALERSILTLERAGLSVPIIEPPA